MRQQREDGEQQHREGDEQQHREGGERQHREGSTSSVLSKEGRPSTSIGNSRLNLRQK